MRSLAIALFASLLLSACSSLSESECLTADWQSIGFTDGSKGRAVDYIASHRKACADVGVTPDTRLWLAGRDEGLLEYCTPTNAYKVGRSGRALAPVCPPEVAAEMSDPHYFGQRYHQLGQQIQELERDLAEVNRGLRRLRGTNGSADLEQRSQLTGQRSWLRQRISELKIDRQHFSRWPR